MSKRQHIKDMFARVWKVAVVFLNPNSWFFKKKLKNVQNRPARFVIRNYCIGTGSITGILEKLKWRSLKKRRGDSTSVIQRSKSCSQHSKRWPYPPIRRCKNHHSLTHIRPPLQEMTFTRANFPLKLLEIGIRFQIRSLPLLKVRQMVWRGSPLCWEQGTISHIIGPGE